MFEFVLKKELLLVELFDKMFKIRTYTTLSLVYKYVILKRENCQILTTNRSVGSEMLK